MTHKKNSQKLETTTKFQKFSPKLGITLILISFILISTFYSFNTPTFEAPDEWVHYWTIAYFSGDIEQISPLLPDRSPLYYYTTSLYLRVLSFFGFDVDNTPQRFTPNGYLHWLHDSEEEFPFSGFAQTIHLLRLFSVALGAITVFFTYQISKIFFKKNHLMALIPPLGLLFIPNFTWLSGILNDDNMVIVLTTASLYFLIKYNNQLDFYKDAIIGLVVGFALLSKFNAIILLPLILCYFIFQYLKKNWNRKYTFKHLTIIMIIAITIPLILSAYLFQITEEFIFAGIELSDIFSVIERTEHPYTGRTVDKLLTPQLIEGFWTGLGHKNIYGPLPLTILYLSFTTISLVSILVFFLKGNYQTLTKEQKNIVSIMTISIIIMLIAFSVYLKGGTGMARNTFAVISSIVILTTVSFYFNLNSLKKKYHYLAITLIILSISGFFSFSNFISAVDESKTADELRVDNSLKNLMTVYNSNKQLKQAFPEAKSADFENLNRWAISNGVKSYPILLGKDYQNFIILSYYYIDPNLQKIFPEVENGNFTNIRLTFETMEEKFPQTLNQNMMKMGLGSIDLVNRELLRNKETVVISDSNFVEIHGWHTSQSLESVDLLYLYIDEQIFHIIAYGIPRNDVVDAFGQETFNKSGWNVIIPSEKLSSGCHSISVLALEEDELTAISTSTKLCLT